MRTWLSLAALVAVVSTSSAVPAQQSAPVDGAGRDPVLWKRALELHRDAIVVDTHCDMPYQIADNGWDLARRRPEQHVDVATLAEGGIDGEFFVSYVDKRYAEEGGATRRALDLIDIIYDLAEKHPEQLEMAYTADDIRRIARTGKTAALIGIEGGHAIEDSLAALRMFHKLGVRYMTLTHSNTNNWADSSGDLARWDGLNDLGRDVVREMNRIGMLVDISHVSDATFFDVIETTKAPVIASHSSARALSDHSRNMSDEMLRAVTKNGGVVMVNFFSTFIDQRRVDAAKAQQPEIARIRKQYAGDEAAMEKALDEYRKANPLPDTPLSVLIDHIDHVAKVAGVDHVGLGSDFDGVTALPVGLEHAGKLPVITYELLRRGYTEEQVRKILGGNFLRVMTEAERVAAAMQTTARIR